MKEQLSLSIVQSYVDAFADVLLGFVLCFVAWWPLTLTPLGFLVYSFWNNWDLLLRGAYSKTWISMVAPVLSLAVGAHWWQQFQGNAWRLAPSLIDDGGLLLKVLFALFLVIWIAVYARVRPRLDNKLMSLFFLQFYITVAANFSAGIHLIPWTSSSL